MLFTGYQKASLLSSSLPAARPLYDRFPRPSVMCVQLLPSMTLSMSLQQFTAGRRAGSYSSTHHVSYGMSVRHTMENSEFGD